MVKALGLVEKGVPVRTAAEAAGLATHKEPPGDS